MFSKERIAELTAGNTAFSNEHPGLQLAWDTVSTGYLKECAMKYYLAIVEGWTPKNQSVHLKFGLVAHSARAIYDMAKADNQTHKEAMRTAVRHCFESSGEYRDEFICTLCGKIHVEDKGICFGCNEAGPLSPETLWYAWRSDDPNKNLKTLVRTMVWYFEKYKDSPAKTLILENGEPAVELWFRFELTITGPDGKPYILTGHLDRLESIAESNWFNDFKTSKNKITDKFFAKFKPDNQMYFYSLGCQIVLPESIAGGIIDGAQVAVNFSDFRRGFVQLTKDQIEEWLVDIQVWIKQAEGYALANHWPMNDKSCHHFGGCDFVNVCNKDRASRRTYLKTYFTQRVWDPLVKREN